MLIVVIQNHLPQTADSDVVRIMSLRGVVPDRATHEPADAAQPQARRKDVIAPCGQGFARTMALP